MGTQSVLRLYTQRIDNPIIHGMKHNLCQQQYAHAYAIMYQFTRLHTCSDINSLLAQKHKAERAHYRNHSYQSTHKRLKAGTTRSSPNPGEQLPCTIFFRFTHIVGKVNVS
jgi:hypothetical protein